MSEESDNRGGSWEDEIPPLEPRGSYDDDDDDGSSALASDTARGVADGADEDAGGANNDVVGTGNDESDGQMVGSSAQLVAPQMVGVLGSEHVAVADADRNSVRNGVTYVAIRQLARNQHDMDPYSVFLSQRRQRNDLGGVQFRVEASGSVNLRFGDVGPLVVPDHAAGPRGLVSPSAPAGLLPLPDVFRGAPPPRSPRQYDPNYDWYLRRYEPFRPRLHPPAFAHTPNYDWYRRIYHYSFRLVRAASLQRLRRMPDEFPVGGRFGGIEVPQGEELASLSAIYNILRHEPDAWSYWRPLRLLFEVLDGAAGGEQEDGHEGQGL